MSRSTAKIATLHDMQCRYSDVILTKKDCDVICNALKETYDFNEISDLYFAFKKLTRITYGKSN